MTYPQYPQQGIAPQYQPGGYPPPAQPQPAQAVPAQQYPQAHGDPFSGDPFADAMPTQRDGARTDEQGNIIVTPTFRTLGVGRLLIIIPKSWHPNEDNPFKNQGPNSKPTRNRLVADVVIANGAPFMFGGDPQKGTPDQFGPAQAPCLIRDMWITQEGIIEKVPPTKVGGGFVIGRLWKGQSAGGNHPWNFGWPKEATAAEIEADKATLRPAYDAWKAGTLPEPMGKIAPQVHQQTHAQPAPPVYASPNQPAAMQQAAPAYNPYTQPPPGYAQPQMPAYPPNAAMGMQAVQGPPAPPVAPAPPAVDWTLQQASPQGWAPEQWQQIGPAQREQTLAMMGVRNPNVPQSGVPAASAQGSPPPF